MSKEEIKELLREFFTDYDTHRWSNDGVYEKYIELLYKPISDLEAKLAEKDAELEKWSTQYARAYVNRQNDLIAKNNQLKQQLEEKEDEIDKLTQDKISFALEQLEKVKNRVESQLESIYKTLDDLNIKIVDESTSRQLSTYEEIVKDIDNQINELKETK